MEAVWAPETIPSMITSLVPAIVVISAILIVSKCLDNCGSKHWSSAFDLPTQVTIHTLNSPRNVLWNLLYISNIMCFLTPCPSLNAGSVDKQTFQFNENV